MQLALLIGVIMAFTLIGAGSDLSSTQSQINTNILELKGREVTEVFKDDTGTRRVLLGKGPEGFYGLKVSQEGNDVYTATDDQLVFNSDNNMFKIALSGVATVTTPASFPSLSVQTATIPHGLSTTPAFTAFVTAPETGGGLGPVGILTSVPMMMTLENAAEFGADVVIHVYATADATNLYLNVKNSTSSSLALDNNNWEFRYYIFQETAN